MKATALLLALVFTTANATDKLPDVIYQSWGDTVIAPNGKKCPTPKEIKKWGVIERCVKDHKVQIVSYGVDDKCNLEWIKVRDLGTPLECAL